MRNLLLGVMLAIILVLIYRLIIMQKNEKSKLATDLSRLHIMAAAMTFVYALTIMVTNEKLVLLFQGLYYVCTDIVLFLFLIYINDFTQKMGEKKRLRLLVMFFIVIDAILNFVNMFNQCLYSVKLCTDDIGYHYYSLTNQTYLFLYHKVVSYSLVTFAIVLLILSIVKAARIYVMQYWAILYCFLIAVAVNILHVIFNFEYDYSVLLYGLVALAVYYFTFSYVPKGLIEKTLVMIAHKINDGVLCFAVSGRCVYANSFVKQIFHAEDNYRKLDQYYRTWLAGRTFKEVPDTSWKEETEINGEKNYFTIKFRWMLDEQNRCIGSYFVIHDDTEHVNRLEEERYRNSHDSLTGLYNGDYFYEKAGKQVRENPHVKYVIFCADIQNFKIINDIFGEKKGDDLLKSVADMFTSLATGDTICARINSDRFALCIREEKINHQRYLEAVEKVSCIGEDNTYRAHIYAGICLVKDVKVPINTYCDRAFLAIESIKGDYHHKIAYYDEELRQQILEDQRMVNDFRAAILKRELQIFLQPQVDENGNMIGAEALARWFRPVYGMTLPEDFIHVFERTGLISAMDQYIWEQACKQLQIWQKNGKGEYYISVNISPRDFYFMDIYQTLTTLVECYEIPPQKLYLEITETSVMKDAAKNLKLIDELRTYGFRVIMDDFGSGYSSLNMLQDMNLDAIKIDMEFLRRNDDPERSRTILEMILELSNELGIEVITEGVERKDQLDNMQKLGCKLFQGFYFAKPMPVNQFEKKYF